MSLKFENVNCDIILGKMESKLTTVRKTIFFIVVRVAAVRNPTTVRLNNKNLHEPFGKKWKIPLTLINCY